MMDGRKWVGLAEGKFYVESGRYFATDKVRVHLVEGEKLVEEPSPSSRIKFQPNLDEFIERERGPVQRLRIDKPLLDRLDAAAAASARWAKHDSAHRLLNQSPFKVGLLADGERTAFFEPLYLLQALLGMKIGDTVSMAVQTDRNGMLIEHVEGDSRRLALIAPIIDLTPDWLRSLVIVSCEDWIE